MRKIAIVGRAGTNVFAPWQDETWEIWGMPWISYPRVDRLFEPHCQQVNDELPPEKGDPSWVPQAQAKYADIPVFCDPTRMHLFKKAIEYPIDEITDFLPFLSLESTISYMLALAIYERADHIGLWGIHMMGRGEFMWQRPSVTYLVGLAQGLGIDITIPAGSPLFMSGYEGGRYGLPGGERFSQWFGTHGPDGIAGTFSDKSALPQTERK